MFLHLISYLFISLRGVWTEKVLLFGGEGWTTKVLLFGAWTVEPKSFCFLEHKKYSFFFCVFGFLIWMVSRMVMETCFWRYTGGILLAMWHQHKDMESGSKELRNFLMSMVVANV